MERVVVVSRPSEMIIGGIITMKFVENMSKTLSMQMSVSEARMLYAVHFINLQ
jgi:hypothetical protein